MGHMAIIILKLTSLSVFLFVILCKIHICICVFAAAPLAPQTTFWRSSSWTSPSTASTIARWNKSTGRKSTKYLWWDFWEVWKFYFSMRVFFLLLVLLLLLMLFFLLFYVGFIVVILLIIPWRCTRALDLSALYLPSTSSQRSPKCSFLFNVLLDREIWRSTVFHPLLFLYSRKKSQRSLPPPSQGITAWKILDKNNHS